MSYTGPVRDWEGEVRTPSTNKGGLITGKYTTTGNKTTVHTLVYCIKALAASSVTLRNVGVATDVWQVEAGEFVYFDDPLEFPAGMNISAVAGTVYIGYKA